MEDLTSRFGYVGCVVSLYDLPKVKGGTLSKALTTRLGTHGLLVGMHEPYVTRMYLDCAKHK